MSSASTQTCGWRSSTAASAVNSSREYTTPVGLLGGFRMNHLVFGVIAASSADGVILYPSSSRHTTGTGVPSARSGISRYETQYGAGVITSSPADTVAMIAL